MPTESEYEAILKRYGFHVPDAYRELQRRGWLKDRPEELFVASLPEVNWMPLDEIASYEFADYHKPGFVPFGDTHTSDLWCWWPEATQNDVCPVVMCYRDFEKAELYAPSFSGFIYRQIMTSCVVDSCWMEDERKTKMDMLQWHDDYKEFFPSQWCETILATVQKPWVVPHIYPGYPWCAGILTYDQMMATLRQDMEFPRLGEEFDWMISR